MARSKLIDFGWDTNLQIYRKLKKGERTRGLIIQTGKGWRRDSARHSLAAKGIESGTKEEIEASKKSLFPLPYKYLKETCSKTASSGYRKLWADLIKGMTDEEFERWRYYIYLKPNYTVNFKASSDNRTRKQWAKDKAYDDVLNRKELTESILEG